MAGSSMLIGHAPMLESRSAPLANLTEAVPSPDHKEQPAEPDSTTFATEHLYFARAPS